MEFYVLEPEVAGSIHGQKSIITDVGVVPPRIEYLDYRFDGWLGDDLLESVLTFIVTERLKDALLEISPTGVEFASMTTSKSEQFEEMYPNKKLPKFVWLKITGQGGVDDFGFFDKARTILAGKITQGKRLVVSERVLDIMEKFQIDNCEIDILSASLQEAA